MAEVLIETQIFSVPPQYFKDLITSYVTREKCLDSRTFDTNSIKNGILAVELDFTDVTLFDPAFAFMIIHNPIQLQSLFEETLNELCKSYCQDSVGIRSCRVRFYNLPAIPEISKFSISSILNSTTSLIQLSGTVVRTGGIRMLELSKRFQCAKKSCQKEFSVVADPEQNFLLPHPTRCPASRIVEGHVQRCNSSEFRELFNAKQCVDYQEIRIYDKVENISLGTIPRSITVVLMDTLVNCVSPGDDVVVTGTLLRQWKPPCRNFRCGIDIVLRANHISRSAKSFVESTEKRLGSFEFRDSYQLQQAKEPKRIEIETAEDRSPFDVFWKQDAAAVVLRERIITSVCPDLCGLWTAKLSLLLAVIGGSDTSRSSDMEGRRSNIHLLLAGDPGSGKSQLLRFAGEMTERSVLTTGIGTTGAGLTCSAQRDSSSISSSGSSEWYLEAGALVLASGGVCCIDEFGTMKEQDRAAIHEAMEQQTISVAKAGLIVKLDCKCSVVAATNIKGKFDISADLSSNTGIAPPLLSRFDLVQVMIDRPDRDWDKKVSTFLLKRATSAQSATNSSNVSSLSVVWLKHYITYIKKRFQPQLSSIAFDLLNKYYRLQRQQSQNSSSIRLIESLIRVSQAHARLMYRNTVDEMDAVVAIDLISQSIHSSSLLEDATNDKGSISIDPMDVYERSRHRVFRMLGVSVHPRPFPFATVQPVPIDNTVRAIIDPLSPAQYSNTVTADTNLSVNNDRKRIFSSLQLTGMHDSATTKHTRREIDSRTTKQDASTSDVRSRRLLWSKDHAPSFISFFEENPEDENI